jgi:hypothetical protein
VPIISADVRMDRKGGRQRACSASWLGLLKPSQTIVVIGNDRPELKASFLLMDNRHGLVTDAVVTEATGTAAREAALKMLKRRWRKKGQVTVGGDKGYDTHGFVEAARKMKATPHVAQNTGRRGGSAIDTRTARHTGYSISQKTRKRVEEIFGWMKTVATMRKTRHRGTDRVDWMFTFTAAAYNLIRMRNILAEAA